MLEEQGNPARPVKMALLEPVEGVVAAAEFLFFILESNHNLIPVRLICAPLIFMVLGREGLVSKEEMRGKRVTYLLYPLRILGKVLVPLEMRVVVGQVDQTGQQEVLVQ